MMSSEKTLTIEALLGDEFKIETKMGEETLFVFQSGGTVGSDKSISSLQYFFLSLGSCVASIASHVNQQENSGVRALKLTIKGDIESSIRSLDGTSGYGSDLSGIEVEADIEADMSVEDKAAFLADVDATLRTLFNLTAYKQRLKDRA